MFFLKKLKKSLSTKLAIKFTDIRKFINNIKKTSIYNKLILSRKYKPIVSSMMEHANFNPDTHIKLFSTILDKRDIEFDYILFELKRIVLENNIQVDDLELDEVFEFELTRCCNDTYNLPVLNNDIFKTKMRFFYVIIANNIHEQLFDKKKSYETTNTNHKTGVYSYDRYIFRIDESHHCFTSEKIVTDNIKLGHNNEPHIVLPFIQYINSIEPQKLEKQKKHSNSCDNNENENLLITSQPHDTEPNKVVFEDVISYSKHLTNIFKKNNLSFSVQPNIKNTESMLYWVKDNITDKYHIIILNEIRKKFIIQLFYKCTCLIDILHLHDIVHGDIKPDNILFEELDDFDITNAEYYKNFSVHLIDYGLSGLDNKDIGTGGTTPYCHPEFRNIRDSNNSENYRWRTIYKKHDVWSLGLAFITLYVLGKFNSYYCKYPNYFFSKDGYVNDIVIDAISNTDIRSLFKDMLTPSSITITDVKFRLQEIISNTNC